MVGKRCGAFLDAPGISLFTFAFPSDLSEEADKHRSHLSTIHAYMSKRSGEIDPIIFSVAVTLSNREYYENIFISNMSTRKDFVCNEPKRSK
jgi:hypothetical protein